MSVDLLSSSGTSGTSSTGSTNGVGTPPAPSTDINSLGADAFLKLLVTQLQNQNPTEPQSNTEFVAQLAQFSSLQALTDIDKQMTALTTLLGGPKAPATKTQ